MKERKRWLSLASKLNILIMAIMLIMATGLTVIAYNVNSERVDNYFGQAATQAASTVAAFMDADFAERMLNAVKTDDFQATREKAIAENNEDMIMAWLEKHELYADFRKTLDVLATYRDHLGARFVYIQSVEGSSSINLMDPSEDLFYIGSIEISPAPFESYQTNEAIEPTVSTTEYGWLCSAYQPITKKDGRAVSLVGVDIDMNTVMRERKQFLNYMVLEAGVLMIVFILVSVYLMRRMATKPLAMLAKATVEFGEDSDRKLTREDVINLPIRSRDEIGELYGTIRNMQERIVEYLDNLTQVTREKERISAELNIATQIQADMLPRIFPPFPDRKEFDLFATMDPAKEVGGDFYDFFLVDADHIALVMADVSGKGVPAALFMVIAKALIKNQAQMGRSPAETLRLVNEQLCEGNEAELFVTVWLAVIQISTGHGIAANAGHEHPVIRHEGGQFELVEYRHSPAVATMEGIRFREHPFELVPGDTLFVYTDGVPEATDAHNELFGTDRMLKALNRQADADPETLLRNVRQDLDAFVGDAPQFDDITMLGFNFLGDRA